MQKLPYQIAPRELTVLAVLHRLHGYFSELCRDTIETLQRLYGDIIETLQRCYMGFTETLQRLHIDSDSTETPEIQQRPFGDSQNLAMVLQKSC